MRAYELELRRLLDDPEMRAFLAAVPQAGRLLGALWRKLTTEPLPEVLRPPPRPRQVALSDGTEAWEPKPSHPRLDKPPPAPPPARDAPRPTGLAGKPRDYLRIDRLFMR
jgi:hypothetical protein